MAQYIDKDALVAEIERLKERFIAFHHRDGIDWPLDNYGKMRAYNEVLSFLNTLEVKEQLTWQDIRLISEIGDDFMNSEESDNLSEEEYYTEVLNRFKTEKGE